MTAALAAVTGCAARYHAIPDEGPLRVQLNSAFDCVAQAFRDAGYDTVSANPQSFRVAASTTHLTASNDPRVQGAMARQAPGQVPNGVAIPYALDQAYARISIDRATGHVVVDASAHSGAGRDVGDGYVQGPATDREREASRPRGRAQTWPNDTRVGLLMARAAARPRSFEFQTKAQFDSFCPDSGCRGHRTRLVHASRRVPAAV